jgi:4-hydroxythreonine-4-phosphate dehydrogenase
VKSNIRRDPPHGEDADKPAIAITMGDPAGIGPEVIIKALQDPSLRSICRPTVIGDLRTLELTASSLGSSLDTSSFEILDLQNVSLNTRPGIETADTGRASAEYIETAVKLWRDKRFDAVVTAPISKKSLSLAGYKFPGHTEFLAELTGSRQFAMSFFAEKLRVVLVSTHVSLRNAIELVKKDALVDLVRFSHRELSALLGRNVTLAMTGLNPHASEGGMFGTEEQNEIIPAVETCRREFKIDISGPFSPDTIFLRGFKGEFDGVIACYHDQATIAVKSLSFGSSVNVTLGLPLIRTSVDHGTAFDIAGRGIADESSLKAAIRLAAELALISRSPIEAADVV